MSGPLSVTVIICEACDKREPLPARMRLAKKIPDGWVNVNGHTHCEACWQRLNYQRQRQAQA